MAQTRDPVAILGIGTMGHGMAASALRAGIPTIVWNRSREATRDLAGLGAEVAESAASAVGRAAIVVTMVTDANAVISIARDEGMLSALAPGAIWAQMSTIGVRGTDSVVALVERERPDVALFDALGQRTIWVGPVGTGTRVKVVNNTWLAFGAEAVAASVALAHRLGLETGTVLDALGGGPLVSSWQAAKLQRIATGDFSPQFALHLALKDVHLALEAAGDDRFAALGCLAGEWQRAVELGFGDEDLTVAERALDRQGGTR